MSLTSSVPAGSQSGSATYNDTIVRQNLIWAAVYNAVCVPLALTGALPAWAAGLGMALSSLLVVLNASRLSMSPVAPSLTEG